MAAYAALVSIMHIIHDIEHHPSPPISIDKQQLESLTQIVTFLQEFLQGYDSPFAHNDEADPLEMRIAEAAYAAEDVIESHIVDMINLHTPASREEVHSGGENILEWLMQKYPAVGLGGKTSVSAGSNSKRNPIVRPNDFGCPINHARKINSIDDLNEGLQKVIEDMNLLKKEAVKILAQNKTTLEARLQRNEVVSASSVMVGFDDVLLEVMDKLTDGQLVCRVIPVVGMAGSGKTTLARHIYAYPFLKEHFDICGWAAISQQCDTREIVCELLSLVNKRSKEELIGMSEDEVGLALYKYLFKRRFLIVLDDMWSFDAWNTLRRFFPDNENGSRVMVTTRDSRLASQLNNSYCLHMKFLDKVSSWNLFTKLCLERKVAPLNWRKLEGKL